MPHFIAMCSNFSLASILMSSGGGGWKLVEGKHSKSFKDVVRGKWNVERRRISSFFFTSFVSNLRAKDLWTIFQDYGEVHEVEIPARRSGRGDKFDFVRFFDVIEEERLAVKHKLFLNLPMYKKREVQGRLLKESDEGEGLVGRRFNQSDEIILGMQDPSRRFSMRAWILRV